MAMSVRKGGGDMVLESRHLIGLFLLMVVIFGVVFTLGYLLGRNQTDARHWSATTKEEAKPVLPGKGEASAGSAPSAPSEWDIYRSPEPKKPTGVTKTGKTVEVVSKEPPAPPSAKTPATKNNRSVLTAPLVPRGAIVLQVAALTKEPDALALAQALQQKKFPAFVLAPGADHYYRVQVGPYADQQSANIGMRKLETEGFKAIIKR